MRKKVLLAFDDPGGGLVVSSLIDRLIEEHNLELQIYAGHLSENFVNYFEFQKLKSQISREEAEKIIDEIYPDIIVTGTSGGNAEQELRNAAFEKNIKSLVILDFWKDYKRRWLYASYQIELMNDKVCVMDELTKNEMIEESFLERNLIVTGHPYLDKIFNFMDYKPKLAKKNNFLFLSQPLDIIGIKEYDVHPFKILLDAIKKLSEEKKEKFSLTVKLHPSEVKLSKLSELSDLSGLGSLYSSNSIDIKFMNKDKDVKSLIEESEVVIGYNTIAMFEARSMNKRTISLNVVPVKKSLTQAMLTAGIEIVSLDGKKIFDCLMKDDKSKLSKNIFRDGIENCLRVILDELNYN